MEPSAVIHVQDSQLTDSDKILDYSAVLIVPPLSGSLPEGLDGSGCKDCEKALALAKRAVLVVDGSRSSETVKGGVRYYFNFPGIRNGSGWSAAPTNKNIYNGSLDFINTVGSQEQHEIATWEVNVKTRAVLYRNKNVRIFSGIPDY